MYALKNYNRFVVNDEAGLRWVDFGYLRTPTDYRRIVKFDDAPAARAFLEQNPQLEEDFSAWIMMLDPKDWSGFKSPWESILRLIGQ